MGMGVGFGLGLSLGLGPGMGEERGEWRRVGDKLGKRGKPSCEGLSAKDTSKQGLDMDSNLDSNMDSDRDVELEVEVQVRTVKALQKQHLFNIQHSQNPPLRARLSKSSPSSSKITRHCLGTASNRTLHSHQQPTQQPQKPPTPPWSSPPADFDPNPAGYVSPYSCCPTTSLAVSKQQLLQLPKTTTPPKPSPQGNTSRAFLCRRTRPDLSPLILESTYLKDFSCCTASFRSLHDLYNHWEDHHLDDPIEDDDDISFWAYYQWWFGGKQVYPGWGVRIDGRDVFMGEPAAGVPTLTLPSTNTYGEAPLHIPLTNHDKYV